MGPRKSLQGLVAEEEGSWERGEEREPRTNLAQGVLAPGWGREVGVTEMRRLARKRRDPGCPHTPLPHLRVALPPPRPSPGGAEPPSRPAAFISVTPAAAGRRGRGRSAGPGGAGAAGMPQWLPAAPCQSPPRRGEAARAEGGRRGRTGNTVDPPSPPTPRPPPVPHTGCIASSTPE